VGIESEQLVYDYLSRVGDVAGRTPGLTAAQRARLVNELRQTIDSQRASSSSSSVRAEVSSVRRILASLGTPDEVVHRASVVAARPPEAGPAVPAQTRFPAADTPSPASPSIPAQSPSRSQPQAQPQPSTAQGRVEYVSERGGAHAGGTAAWWTPEPEPGGWSASGGIRMVQPPGWTGSFERDFFSPDGTTLVDPVTGMPLGVGVQPVAADPEADGDPLQQQLPEPPSLLRRLFGGGSAAGVPVPVTSAPRSPIPFVEALATLVLTAAAVLGLWYVAALGWLFAYGGRRLGRRVATFASLWIPGLVAAGCGFWLYSRTGHAAGQPGLTGPALTTATRNAFALWLRASAGLSAAFLAWRITRR
jgi:hypothetical protein